MRRGRRVQGAGAEAVRPDVEGGRQARAERALTLEQADLGSWRRPTPTRDLVTAALETGCRGGELHSLQWSTL